ncbi:hypothetical protein [Leifsonia poae]|uniref:hypothetical protein n=1 Tax=Leifsonia poae TaxID=110933 RepID=UPI003D66FDFD
MAEQTDAEFAALAARLTDPATGVPVAANVSTGADAAAGGLEFLLAEYGSPEALDAALRPAGRPRLN